MTIWDEERQNAVEDIVQRLEAHSRGRTSSNDALIIPLDTLRHVLGDVYKQFQSEKHRVVSISMRLEAALRDLRALLDERLL